MISSSDLATFNHHLWDENLIKKSLVFLIGNIFTGIDLLAARCVGSFTTIPTSGMIIYPLSKDCF